MDVHEFLTYVCTHTILYYSCFLQEPKEVYMRLRPTALFAVLAVLASLCNARAEEMVIKLERNTEFKTYYIPIADSESGKDTFLLDTGSTYTVYTEEMFNRLPKDRYILLGGMRATVANGATLTMNRYQMREFILGDCVFPDVEIVVIPNINRPILGVGILKRRKGKIDFVNDTLTLECPAKRSATG